jgi:hypothetical protein
MGRARYRRARPSSLAVLRNQKTGDCRSVSKSGGVPDYRFLPCSRIRWGFLKSQWRRKGRPRLRSRLTRCAGNRGTSKFWRRQGLRSIDTLCRRTGSFRFVRSCWVLVLVGSRKSQSLISTAFIGQKHVEMPVDNRLFVPNWAQYEVPKHTCHIASRISHLRNFAVLASALRRYTSLTPNPRRRHGPQQ